MFDALDKLFMGGGSVRSLALEQLRCATAAASRPAPAAPPSLAGAPGTQRQAAAAAAAAAPSRRRQPVAAVADAGEADDVAVIGGKRYQRLPAAAGINVWVCQKSATKAAPAQPQQAAHPVPSPPPPQPQQPQQVLAFVCHLRATDQLLLLTNLHSRAAAEQLAQHPALPLLLEQRRRVAGVLHLAAPGVAGSRALRQLCKRLQPAVAGAAGGQQVLLEEPGPHGSTQVCTNGTSCACAECRGGAGMTPLALAAGPLLQPQPEPTTAIAVAAVPHPAGHWPPGSCPHHG